MLIESPLADQDLTLKNYAVVLTGRNEAVLRRCKIYVSHELLPGETARVVESDIYPDRFELRIRWKGEKYPPSRERWLKLVYWCQGVKNGFKFAERDQAKVQ